MDAKHVEITTRLVQRLQRGAGDKFISLSRTFAFGGAAVCLAILTQILQVGATDIALLISVGACAIAMPLWIFLGLLLESYLHLGPASFPQFALIQTVSIIKWANALGLIAILVAIAGVFFYLSLICFLLFIAATLVAVILYANFFTSVAVWWFEAGPGSTEHSDEPK